MSIPINNNGTFLSGRVNPFTEDKMKALEQKTHLMQCKHNSASIESLPVISKAACSNSLLLTYSGFQHLLYEKKTTSHSYQEDYRERDRKYFSQLTYLKFSAKMWAVYFKSSSIKKMWLLCGRSMETWSFQCTYFWVKYSVATNYYFHYFLICQLFSQ